MSRPPLSLICHTEYVLVGNAASVRNPFEAQYKTRRLPHHFDRATQESSDPPPLTPSSMIVFTFITTSLLSLLSCTRAAAVSARSSGCVVTCPPRDAVGIGMGVSSTDGVNIFCKYGGYGMDMCVYEMARTDSSPSL